MSDNITLPREVVERLVASWGRDTKAFIDSMDALRARLAAPDEDIEALRRDAERYRWLLREAREYLPEHHPIAESLFPRIDQALQEVPR